jgi:RHS repeat-associated protein
MGAPGLALETWETTSGYYYPSAQYGCWSYDSFGNRTQELFSSQPVNCAQSPQIVYNANNQAPSSLQYDQAGDVTGDSNSGNSYAYDGEGRICAVGVNISGPTSYTQYVYDAEGVRVAKGSAAGLSCSLSSGFTPSSLYLLGQGGEQVTELSVAGGLATPAHSNVFWGGKLLATYDLPNGGFHIALTDPLGTKRVQVSGTGRSELNCLSLPYGNDLGNPRVVNCYTPTYGTPAPDATEHHFTGKERDTESGNDYFEARYYSSSMGRFMSPDPLPWLDWQHGDKDDQKKFGSFISNPQNFNMYAYVNNNPLNKTDPTGMNACGTNSDSSCQVTVTIQDRSKDSNGHYNDQYTGVKGESNYNATASVTVNGKDAGTFLVKTTPSDSSSAATIANGTYSGTLTVHGSDLAIRLQPTNDIPTIGPNPSRSDGASMAQGILVHKAGGGNFTGVGSDGRPVSAGCQVVCTSQYGAFKQATGMSPSDGSAPQKHFTVIVDTQENTPQ